MLRECQIVIIGGGPAGLAAGLYAARARLKTVIIERAKWGGQATTTEELANYPGSVEEPTGPKLMARMKEQAEQFGAELLTTEVTAIESHGDDYILHVKDGQIKAGAVIIGTGAQPQLLGVPGELEFRGKGVSYCATCDADFFTDLEVVVIGGGDAAVEEAIYLTKFASKVTIIHRRNEFRAARSIVDKALQNEKISIIWDSVVEEIRGDGIVQEVSLKNVKTGMKQEMATDGVFIFTGTKPVNDLFNGLIKINEKGYIITDEDMCTSRKGIFAAGDVRVKKLRQVVTAAADGAIAAISAEKYLEEKHEQEKAKKLLDKEVKKIC